MKIIGIYEIINKINNKKYIGKSTNINQRIIEHKKSLNNNKHYNSYLQKSWNKYGKNNFDFNIIEKCDKNILSEKEIFWIKYFKDMKYELYNITAGGEGGDTFTNNSEENKIKRRKRLKELYTGKKRSNSVGKAVSKSKTGVPLTQSHINRIKESAKDNPNYGIRNRILVNNGIVNKYIKPEFLQNFLDIGYKKGNKCNINLNRKHKIIKCNICGRDIGNNNFQRHFKICKEKQFNHV